MRVEGSVQKNWTWVWRYTLVIVVVLVIGGAIGEFELFRETTLGTAKLTASTLVRFLCYGASLFLFWLMGLGTAAQLREGGGSRASLSYILTPLATLIAVACAHPVVLLVLRPLLDAQARNIYNWVFIVGILASAMWLILALLRYSDPILEMMKSTKLPPGPLFARRADASPGSGPTCTKCGATLAAGAKFCSSCGASVPQ